MKKLLSVFLSASILCAYPPVSISVSAKTVPGFDKKTIIVQPFSSAAGSAEVDCLIRSDLPEIPFVNIESYLD